MKTDTLTVSVDKNRLATIMSSCDNNILSDTDCEGTFFESTTKMQTILDEFSKLYNDKLKRIKDDTDNENIQKKVSVLESWIEDLGEQNSVLVSTVEELEKEARSRVSLLQEKLEKMAISTKESCVSLRDHQNQMSSLVSQKVFAEDEVKRLKENLLESDRANASFVQENSDLKDDLDSLVQIISSIRLTGKYQETNSIQFKFIKKERVFGADYSLSLQLKERFPIDVVKSRSKDSLSSYGSLGSTDTDEESSHNKLKAEVKTLRQNNKQTNVLLIQRDQHIADLQCQLSELHHRLAVCQTEIENATSALQTLRDRGRQDTFEICRRDDVIRQLLSPTRTTKVTKGIFSDKLDMELQLSKNIDVMAARLVESEDECQQLRHENVVLKASHVHCAPTIDQLQDQLSSSHMSLEDLRSVLTNEVSERYDHPSCSKIQIGELIQKHKEEIQKKNDEIARLQTEIDLLSKEVDKNMTDQAAQTAQTEMVKKVEPSEDSWFCDTKFLNLSIQMSHLENEVSEKNILLRELQNHLSSSRQELFLKDETLHNIEKKLDSTRRNYNEKEDRMIYLTSQLTSLQLEVSKLHGTAQQLHLQLESKSKLVHKLESENHSLCWQLNEKSALVEKIQKDLVIFEKEIHKKKREILEQKITITTLQDVLVTTKITCDKLKNQFPPEDGGKNCTETESCDSATRDLNEKFEDSQNQRRILLERCNQMEIAHENEYSDFVDRLTCLHEDRLGHIESRLCSCRFHRDSQIRELKSFIEDLANYLQRTHHVALEAEKEKKSLARSLSKERANRVSEVMHHRELMRRVTVENAKLLQKSCSTSEIASKSSEGIGSRINLATIPLKNPVSEWRQHKNVELNHINRPNLEARVVPDRLKVSNNRQAENTRDICTETKLLMASVRCWLEQQKEIDLETEPSCRHFTNNSFLDKNLYGERNLSRGENLKSSSLRSLNLGNYSVHHRRHLEQFHENKQQHESASKSELNGPDDNK